MDVYINRLSSILLSNNVCKSHGIEHAITVLNNAVKALDTEKYDIDETEKKCVLLAALLHDADDRKFFPSNSNYENVREVLKDTDNFIIEKVIYMISLVSSSKNGDRIPDDVKDKEWMLIPRYADRLEAIGLIGIKRCWQYGKTVGNPLFVDTSPKPTTEEDIWKLATMERYKAYNGYSDSTIDHFYDKLLRASLFPIKNKFFDEETKNRRKHLIDFLLSFGNKGSLYDADVQDFLNKNNFSNI